MDTLLVYTFYYFGAILTIVTAIFLLALYKRDNSIMDIAYGPIYLASATTLLLLTQAKDLYALAIYILVALWSLRLALRIYRKNAGRPEDARYAAWREQWTKRGFWYFALRSYGQIYILQGTIIAIIGIPIFLAFTFSDHLTFWPTIIGLGIATSGLIYESIADWQLDRFIKQRRVGAIPDVIMKSGLFQFSRRPNYFGEILIWWGLAVAVSPVAFSWFALLSPLCIAYIVTRVTGPMLEALLAKEHPDEYHNYTEQTNYLIPLPPHITTQNMYYRIGVYIAVGVLLSISWIGPQWYENYNQPATEKVFVYGTLKNPLVRWFACRCTTPNTPATLSDYQTDRLNIVPASGQMVSGYLLDVTTVELERFDRYERVPTRYQRRQVEVANKTVWIYQRAD